VDVHTYDEIEDLAQQFNVMAQSLEQREEQIARYHDELEQKVRLRTRQLANEKDKLQSMQDLLVRSERLAATGEIAAVIAHEMRNSVTSIRMILQLLSENRNLVDTDRDSLDVALDSLGRMERVVRDLLDLGRPTRLDRRPEDVNHILHSSIEFAKHQMGLEETTLEVDLDPELPPLMLDRDRIKEAIVNLILNASQATEGGGTISVRSHRIVLDRELRDLGEVGDGSDEAPGIGVQEIVLSKGSSVAQIDVVDTGRGIPPEHLGRVFDPFFTTKINGTGLGLSFVKRVVNQHGGIVTASSHVNKGSRFSLFIPLGV
ncbi:MAG: ATP-binding protein, partial [Fidelibacterota bacterium]